MVVENFFEMWISPFKTVENFFYFTKICQKNKNKKLHKAKKQKILKILDIHEIYIV